ncbi:MAG TPA: DUF5063 domain-containing protein [Hyphomicrobiaceae bacterium]|nr:DUF5063 domain-containing protein [Hyphomicrobiaceae bacterium]
MPTPAGSISPLHHAISSFIACIEDESLSPDARLGQLAPALDQLSLSYHTGMEPQDAPGEGEPPERDYKAMRELIALRFPNLGYYGAVPPGTPTDSEITMGDAVDDLTDIYSELLDVAWCFEHTSEADGVRLFRFGFSHHWGRHVCDVRGAIHFELFGM